MRQKADLHAEHSQRDSREGAALPSRDRIPRPPHSQGLITPGRDRNCHGLPPSVSTRNRNAPALSSVPVIHSGHPSIPRLPVSSANAAQPLPRAALRHNLLPGFDGAYLRFSGQCRVQYFRAGALVEEFADKSIFRAQMHFSSR